MRFAREMLAALRRSRRWQRFWYLAGWPCTLTRDDFLHRLYGRVRWTAIIRADLCVYCGTPGTPDQPLTREHLVPKSHGGRGLPLNTVGACQRCNTERSSRPLLHYLLWRATPGAGRYDKWLRGAAWVGGTGWSARGAAARRARRRRCASRWGSWLASGRKRCRT